MPYRPQSPMRPLGRVSRHKGVLGRVRVAMRCDPRTGWISTVLAQPPFDYRMKLTERGRHCATTTHSLALPRKDLPREPRLGCSGDVVRRHTVALPCFRQSLIGS
jgi:hypothetical protein